MIEGMDTVMNYADEVDVPVEVEARIVRTSAAVIIIEPECGRCDRGTNRERSVHHDGTHDYPWVKVFDPRCKALKACLGLGSPLRFHRYTYRIHYPAPPRPLERHTEASGLKPKWFRPVGVAKCLSRPLRACSRPPCPTLPSTRFRDDARVRNPATHYGVNKGRRIERVRGAYPCPRSRVTTAWSRTPKRRGPKTRVQILRD
jgi:hypothetical protein